VTPCNLREQQDAQVQLRVLDDGSQRFVHKFSVCLSYYRNSYAEYNWTNTPSLLYGWKCKIMHTVFKMLLFLYKLCRTRAWSTLDSYLNVTVYFHLHNGRRVSLQCMLYKGPSRGKVKCLVAGFRNKDPTALWHAWRKSVPFLLLSLFLSIKDCTKTRCSLL
jgi:hypothetical protein